MEDWSLRWGNHLRLTPIRPVRFPWGDRPMLKTNVPKFAVDRLILQWMEYAEFSDENFYQPDPNNPVLFHLRKKQDSDSLIYRERELKVTMGAVNDIMLDTGGKLQIELLANPRPQQGSWSMRASVVNGGIQVVAEEFPFLAPTDNYQSSLVLDNATPKPPRWTEIYEGGIFYLKAGSIFGRIEIQMISGKDRMRIKSWLNPSGSRNLEFDPAKVIKPTP